MYKYFFAKPIDKLPKVWYNIITVKERKVSTMYLFCACAIGLALIAMAIIDMKIS